MSGVNAAIEVGKHSLEIALGSDGELFSEPNSRAVTRLAKRLAELGCERVLIEGGSYQNVLVAALRAAGLPVVIINPRRVREFAKSIGQLAKTDHLDARVLALYGERIQRPCASFPTTPVVRSDNGLIFQSRRFRAACRDYGLRQEFITPYTDPRQLDVQFAGRLGQTGDDQHRRHLSPRDRFAPRRHQLRAQFVELERAPQLPSQPHPTEPASALDAYAIEAHRQRLRIAGGCFEQLTLGGTPVIC